MASRAGTGAVAGRPAMERRSSWVRRKRRTRSPSSRLTLAATSGHEAPAAKRSTTAAQRPSMRTRSSSSSPPRPRRIWASQSGAATPSPRSATASATSRLTPPSHGGSSSSRSTESRLLCCARISWLLRNSSAVGAKSTMICLRSGRSQTSVETRAANSAGVPSVATRAKGSEATASATRSSLSLLRLATRSPSGVNADPASSAPNCRSTPSTATKDSHCGLGPEESCCEEAARRRLLRHSSSSRRQVRCRATSSCPTFVLARFRRARATDRSTVESRASVSVLRALWACSRSSTRSASLAYCRASGTDTSPPGNASSHASITSSGVRHFFFCESDFGESSSSSSTDVR
mmetsp:Transcript_29162/g.89198  ORF Transcript_29162/g.89198 Transcript_29162/m.89198 type:complete len:349 (+) Transcript_29162:413-1459(+)